MPADAAPCAAYRAMLLAGPDQRRRAQASLTQLRQELDGAARTGLADRFAQASVDLLRGQNSGAAGPAAWVDFDARSAEYCHVLEGVTGHGIVPVK
ncbi:hypothetical protein AB0C40_04355 [Streptomyces brevispora]|uniref:hypothetical protein n=1 Tax=Streptomyces brevispora TaxID=887462 RepID=UPI0033FF6DFF